MEGRPDPYDSYREIQLNDDHNGNNKNNHSDEKRISKIPCTKDEHGPYQDWKEGFGNRKESLTLFEHAEFSPVQARTTPCGQHCHQE